MKMTSIVMCLAIAFIGSASAYAELVVYPAKGQSAEQQKKDQRECNDWAVARTGFDPSKAAPPAAAPAPPKERGGAVRGALVGAAVGDVVDDDAGKGAAVGATVGAARQARRNSLRQQQAASAQQQQAAEQAQARANFDTSVAACLEGRGYTVK